MNSSPDHAHTATAAEMAALEFEPLAGDDLARCKPTRDSLLLHGDSLLFAWKFLGMTKEQLGEKLLEIPEDLLAETLKNFAASITFFEGRAEMIRIAEERLMVAAAAVGLIADSDIAEAAPR